MPTQDISIWDETQTRSVDVTTSNELKSSSRVTDGTNYVTVTNEKLDTNSRLSWENACHNNRCFRAVFSLTVSGTAETNYALIRNPNASGKTIKIHKILLGNDFSTSAVVLWSFYRDSIITANGTTVTPVPVKKTGNNSAVGLFASGPTTSANGTLFLKVNLNQVGRDITEDGGFIIEQNENILIRVQPSLTGKIHTMTIEYEEV